MAEFAVRWATWSTRSSRRPTRANPSPMRRCRAPSSTSPFGGLETTTMALGNIVYRIASEPAVATHLRDPDLTTDGLVLAVEECLRFETAAVDRPGGVARCRDRRPADSGGATGSSATTARANATTPCSHAQTSSSWTARSKRTYTCPSAPGRTAAWVQRCSPGTAGGSGRGPSAPPRHRARGADRVPAGHKPWSEGPPPPVRQRSISDRAPD